MWIGSSVIRHSNPCGLPGALVEFFQVGFERPSEGDHCIVEGRISLPAKGNELSDEYCFGGGFNLCEKPLTPDWGAEMAQGLRTASMQCKADTFAEAFEGAEKEVMEALGPLAKAYHERKGRRKAAMWQP